MLLPADGEVRVQAEVEVVVVVVVVRLLQLVHGSIASQQPQAAPAQGHH